MAETIGEWRHRKLGQVIRFKERDPQLLSDTGGDYGTKYALCRVDRGAALVIGQLARDDIGQPRIDLTDDQIEEWAGPLRARNRADA